MYRGLFPYLSVSAQLEAPRDNSDKNGYLVAREYIDEAESGRVANHPNSARWSTRGACRTLPSRSSPSGSVHDKAWNTIPGSNQERGPNVNSPLVVALPYRQSSRQGSRTEVARWRPDHKEIEGR